MLYYNGGDNNDNKKFKWQKNKELQLTNIISLSGGKDSTAMLLMMLEKKIKIDYIVFFDTGWEFPEMYEHINKLEKCIGREIIRLRYIKSFQELFKQYGFPSFQNRWCTARKIQTVNKFCNKHKPFTQWIGFSYDEVNRIKKTMGYCYPLVDWKVTEEDALKYCLNKGFDWSGLYEKYKRLSCWDCPLQSLSDLKVLWKDFPDYWKRLLDMQKQSKWQFRMDYTLEQLDERFRKEEMQLSFDI